MSQVFSQGQSQAPSIDSRQIMNAAEQVGIMLASAVSNGVTTWTSEHIDRAFGWAAWLDQTLENSILDTDNGLVDLDEDLAKMQDARPGMPPRALLPISVDLLKTSQALLLRTLLRNPLTPADVLINALRVGRDELSASVVLPAVRVDAELRLLALLGQTAQTARAAARRPSSATPSTAATEGVADGAATSATTDGATTPRVGSAFAHGLGELLWQTRPTVSSEPERQASHAAEAAVAAASVPPPSRMRAEALQQRLSQLLDAQQGARVTPVAGALPNAAAGADPAVADPAALEAAAELLRRTFGCSSRRCDDGHAAGGGPGGGPCGCSTGAVTSAIGAVPSALLSQPPLLPALSAVRAAAAAAEAAAVNADASDAAAGGGGDSGGRTPLIWKLEPSVLAAACFADAVACAADAAACFADAADAPPPPLLASYSSHLGRRLQELLVVIDPPDTAPIDTAPPTDTAPLHTVVAPETARRGREAVVEPAHPAVLAASTEAPAAKRHRPREQAADAEGVPERLPAGARDAGVWRGVAGGRRAWGRLWACWAALLACGDPLGALAEGALRHTLSRARLAPPQRRRLQYLMQAAEVERAKAEREAGLRPREGSLPTGLSAPPGWEADPMMHAGIARVAAFVAHGQEL